MDEKDFLREAVARGWISEARLSEMLAGSESEWGTWKIIPRLFESGELTLEQVEALSAVMEGGILRNEEIPNNTDPSEFGERYEIGELIGSGGMSEVYRAFDRNLQRHVALKKLKTQTADPSPRFLREARLQARIEHESICRIYDVGRQGNEWYIAMALISGRTLKQAGVELGLEEKVRLVKEAAEGLHAAHRLGLVHRDVKPANIMVGISDEGWSRAVITDFGLVRDTRGNDVTLTQDLAGSPSYMAPEQVSGGSLGIDRRADVWGMGVTLYELLSGRLPFAGEGLTEVSLQILQRDPLALRKIAPDIPVDLETIVMKCLEKERSRRYGSMRELGDDLGRFLDGTPISARRYNLLQKMWKQVRRHKLVSGGAAMAAVLVLVTAGLWLQARNKTRVQAEIAGRFGRDVEKMESIMRFAYLLPPHDIRADRDRVRETMEEIRKKMEDLGKVGQGPGHYALGQGYLALREFKEARMHLEMAWERGVRTPDTAFAMGVTLGELYQSEWKKAERIFDKDLRMKVGRQLEVSLAQSALKMMNAAKASGIIPARHIEAQIAFFMKEYDSALALLDQEAGSCDLFYQGNLLRGSIYQKIGANLDLGGKIEDAYHAFQKSLNRYLECICVGRSDPVVFLQMAELYERIASCEMELKGRDPNDSIFQGIRCCEQAIAIDPDFSMNYIVKSNIFCLQTKLLGRSGKDTSDSLKHAVEAIRKALERSPSDDYCHYIAGKVFQTKYNWGPETGQTSIKIIQESVSHLQEALKINPNNHLVRQELTRSLTILASAQFFHSENPVTTLIEKAVDIYRPLISDFPDFTEGYFTLGNTIYLKFYVNAQRGKVDWQVMNQAVESFQKAISLAPGVSKYYTILGLLLANKAQFERQYGRNSAESLHEARRYMQHAMELNPGNPVVYVNLALIQSEYAYLKTTRGRNPGEQLIEAEKWLRKARIMNATSREIFYPMILIPLVKAWCSFQKKQPIQLYVKEAERIFRKGTAIDDTYFELYEIYARIQLLQARLLIRKNHSPERIIGNIRNLMKQMLERKPDHFLGYLILGRSSLLMAEHNIKRGINPESDFDSAERNISKSLSLNPSILEGRSTMEEIVRLRTRWKGMQKKRLD